MSFITPAVLPSSRADLEEKLALFARIPKVKRIQIDVVDGKFATPASWPYTDSTGSPQAAQKELEMMVRKEEMLPRLDSIEYEIDLMCFDAPSAAARWLALGATRLTFHAESITDLPRVLASARKQYGSIVSFGIALNSASDFALLEPCLDNIEYVQFMGIARIGQQGRPFDRSILKKVRAFRSRHPFVPVQIDGGVTLASARELVTLGVKNLVVGSGILKANNPAAAFAAFEELQNPFGV